MISWCTKGSTKTEKRAHTEQHITAHRAFIGQKRAPLRRFHVDQDRDRSNKARIVLVKSRIFQQEKAYLFENRFTVKVDLVLVGILVLFFVPHFSQLCVEE